METLSYSETKWPYSSETFWSFFVLNHNMYTEAHKNRKTGSISDTKCKTRTISRQYSRNGCLIN